ncbi:MAG: YajQ family cyclic di-GMP-binding protein [Chloroflexi bacterium]|nr:YajQ family cyclic di-GMP-binding protein [Chloroflexota bacterium]
MPSFDVVNELNLQELDNAINNTQREISTRYDFRNVITEMNFNKKEKKIHIFTADDMHMNAIKDSLALNMRKRNVDPRVLQYGKVLPTEKGHVVTDITLVEGIEKEECKKVVKFIKGLNLKVEAQIMDDQVRVSGKKIDDLQAVIAALKAEEFIVPLQFVNMRP